MTINLADSAGRRWLSAGWALTLVGAIMFPVAIVDLRNSSLPQTWPTTAGLVTTSEVRSTTNSSGRLGVDVVYFPHVNYNYTIGGQNYVGAHVYHGKGPDSQQAAQTVVDRYRVGSRVSVYYNPQKPDIAVLETPIQLKDYYAAIGTFVGLIIGLACLLRFRKIRREELGLSGMTVRYRPKGQKSGHRERAHKHRRRGRR